MKEIIGYDELIAEGFSVRFVNCILRCNITLKQLMDMEDHEILHIRGFGRKCIKELHDYKERTILNEEISYEEKHKPSPIMEKLLEEFHSSKIDDGQFIISYHGAYVGGFLINNRMSSMEVKCKVLSWLVKPIIEFNALEEESNLLVRNRLLEDLNCFFNKKFSLDDIKLIILHLSGPNKSDKQIEFIISGCNLKSFKRLG